MAVQLSPRLRPLQTSSWHFAGGDPEVPRKDDHGGSEQQELLPERDEPEAETAEGRGAQVLPGGGEEGPERSANPEVLILVRLVFRWK